MNEIDNGVVNWMMECPDGYIFKDENGNVINASKIVLEKKKPKYPKSLAECLEILDYSKDALLSDKKGLYSYRVNLLADFQKLLICRDAYWKIAGEEMGLGKPWEPDWRKARYIIYRNQDNIIGGYREVGHVEHHIFEFPTKEMRDAFKENFKDLIEDCKELL